MHRSPAPPPKALSFNPALNAGITLDPATIRRMILRHLRTGLQDLN